MMFVQLKNCVLAVTNLGLKYNYAGTYDQLVADQVVDPTATISSAFNVIALTEPNCGLLLRRENELIV